MTPLNIIPIEVFKTKDFLDCIDIYNNEPFVVIKDNVPHIIVFPGMLIEEFKKLVNWTEEQEILQEEIERTDIFNNTPEYWKVFILKVREHTAFAIVRYQHHITYPAVQGLFKNWKLFEDYLWDYPKPYMDPKEMKRVMTTRFLIYGKYEYIDREYLKKNKAEILENLGIMVKEEQKREIRKYFWFTS